MLTMTTPLRVLLLGAVAALCLALTSPALAARGGGGAGGGGGGGKPPKGGGSATIALVLLESTDGLPHWGQRVTFAVTTSDPQPYVNLKCYQGGALVAQSTEGFFAGALDDGVFGLYSPIWSAGAADCTADVKTATGAVIGTTAFHVYAE